MNRTPSRPLLAGLGLALAAAGCGDGDASGSCSEFAACGGEVVASWKIQDTCGAAESGLDSCPGARVDYKDLDMKGTLSFAADMTYTSSVTLGGSARLTLPKSCLTMGGTSLSCKQLEALFTLATAQGDSPISAFTCAEMGDACDCRMTFKPTPSEAKGTWRTMGNQLFTRAEGSRSESASEYCVSGRTLKMKSAAMPGMGSLGMPGMSASGSGMTLVLTKS